MIMYNNIRRSRWNLACNLQEYTMGAHLLAKFGPDRGRGWYRSHQTWKFDNNRVFMRFFARNGWHMYRSSWNLARKHTAHTTIYGWSVDGHAASFAVDQRCLRFVVDRFRILSVSVQGVRYPAVIVHQHVSSDAVEIMWLVRYCDTKAELSSADVVYCSVWSFETQLHETCCLFMPYDTHGHFTALLLP